MKQQQDNFWAILVKRNDGSERFESDPRQPDVYTEASYYGCGIALFGGANLAERYVEAKYSDTSKIRIVPVSVEIREVPGKFKVK